MYPMEKRQSDLTETSRRALKANRGKEENLKSTYGSLQSDYKAKCNIMKAEQSRFVRLMKTKLPSIKVSAGSVPSDSGSVSRSASFVVPPNSPIFERQKSLLPPLVKSPQMPRRWNSFSDLTQDEGSNKQEEQARNKKRSLSVLNGKGEENLFEPELFDNIPRSRSTSDLTQLASNSRHESEEWTERTNGTSSVDGRNNSRKDSSPARLLSTNLEITRPVSQRKLTNEKSLSKQLAEVKDLRYLRTGKYSSIDDG